MREKNDSLDSDLEAALRELEPVEVPRELEARIFEIFEGRVSEASGGTGSKVVRFPVLRSIGAAAAIAIAATGVLFAVINTMDRSRSGNGGPLAGDATQLPTSATFVPVRAENVFQGAQDEGVYFTDERVPVRQIRYQFSNSFRWENPQDGSTIEMTVPQEKLFIVPLRTD